MVINKHLPQYPSLRNSISGLIDECKSLRQLKRIHARLLTSPFISDPDRSFLAARFLLACAISPDSASLAYAHRVFSQIQNPNRFAYNAMIRAYATNTRGVDDESGLRALALYNQMLRNGVAPDCLTFPFLVKACAKGCAFLTGQTIHAQAIQSGYGHDLFVQNSLISLYSASGVLATARLLFEKMPDRDVVSWNTMINGCLRNGDPDSALSLFGRMEERSIFTWNTMITGLVHLGRAKEALELFHDMRTMDNGSTIKRPDKMTIASALAACAALGAIDQGEWVHAYLKRTGLECDMVIGTALVDMYGKCGAVERALEVFNAMPSKDVLAWTAIISAFALHGYCDEAFGVLQNMVLEGARPNHVTFVSLLSACSHSGSVEKARWCFEMMQRIYSIVPRVEHYACMVGVLSRAGFLQEAEELIKSMPMAPDVYVWGALLGGCQVHGNIELGERVASTLIRMEPWNQAFYVNLCDVYGKAGRFSDAKMIRGIMKEREIKKAPGCSRIEIDGVVYEFSITESDQVLMKGVLWILNGISNQMRLEGDVYGMALN